MVHQLRIPPDVVAISSLLEAPSLPALRDPPIARGDDRQTLPRKYFGAKIAMRRSPTYLAGRRLEVRYDARNGTGYDDAGSRSRRI